MITIGKPFVEKRNGEVVLKALISDEKQGISDYAYFSTSDEYGNYLVDEVADCFVVGMLLPALRSKQDITVDAPISEKLYYGLCNSLIYTLKQSWGGVNIKVHVTNTVVPHFDAHAVGCGCSLGVDSFAAMLSHMGEDCPESYRITHLTYFNVGAHGYKNLEATRKSYLHDLEMTKKYAASKGLPVVCIESNFAIFYDGFNFDQCGDIRNMSTVLSMQKLFGKYLYASSFPIKNIKLTPDVMGYYDSLLLPMLSTENTELIVANPDMDRTDKIRFIADNPDVQKSLYVCWKELIVNNNPNSPIAAIKDNYLNCTRCDKCLRTVLALDVMGKLDAFKGIFDLDYWGKVKVDYISKVCRFRKTDAFYSDLYQFMLSNSYTIPLKSKLKTLLYRTKVMGVYNRIVRIFK